MTSTVHLEIPASGAYLAVARAAATGLAAQLQFTYEEIDDLRIAVTELCHLLIGDGAAGTVTLEFRTDGDGVAITGRAEHPGIARSNEFSETILARVVDSHSVTDDGKGRVFDLSKRRRPG